VDRGQDFTASDPTFEGRFESAPGVMFWDMFRLE
jgi:hypothetical protein